VTLAGRYIAGVAAVGAAGLVAAAASPVESRPGILWGLFVGLLLQAPLGWWTLRAIGTERFFMVWGLGMLVRFAVVAVAAFALLPAPDRLASPMLVTMVGVLLALLLVEGAVAMRANSREDER
jgi:heme A synthase